MAERENETERGVTAAEGLAGGPGPTPPGFDDGTPRPLEAPAGGPAAAPAGERHEPRGDPEEPDPS